jgi:BCD family chlorophyll transporter-like MFS transporter
MSRLRKNTIRWLAGRGTRWMPFADVATPDLPLGRLLRLSLFQVTTAMTLVLLVGTLNRVMIVELGVPASLVGLMIALPVVAAPFRAFIGFKSDIHRSALGWRRVPFIWKGSLLQFGGFAFMPFALLVLAGQGQAGYAPVWVGQLAAAVSFLVVGAGVHTVQTAGLALATDLTPSESHPRVVGLLYVVFLAGMIVSALAFGAALQDFTPGRLVQVVQAVAVASLALNVIAIWKQETRRPDRGEVVHEADPTFQESWATLRQGGQVVRRLVVVGVGTLAFGMADILLEPFGGQVLDLSVSATTLLTALFAFGGLVGFGLASRLAGEGADAHGVARAGALVGVPAFALVMLAEPFGVVGFFLMGNFLIGFGGALFSHGTLTAAMNRAPQEQAGLALGAWGAVQATAAGVAIAVSSGLRDLVTWGMEGRGAFLGIEGMELGYLSVYALEIVLLGVAVIATLPLLREGGADAPRGELAPAASGAGAMGGAGSGGEGLGHSPAELREDAWHG